MLKLAALLLLIIGGAHSYLGERYILIRLFKKGSLPALFGGPDFTKSTIRFAWHLTTLAWIGFAAILYLLSYPDLTATSMRQILLQIISATFFVSALLSGGFTRGKHLSWVVFLAIAWIAFQSSL